MSSGFGRNAGPSGPGSAALAFGAGAAAAATSPSPATPPASVPFPSTRPVGPPFGGAASRFPSPRPQLAPAAATSRFPNPRPQLGAAAPTSRFPSPRPQLGAAAPTSRFPSPRPQLGAAAATSRPTATSPIPIPLSSTRAGTAPGAANSARFPASRPALDPGAAAATARHVERHVQSPPRPAAPSVNSPVNPAISSMSRFPSPLSNQRADSLAGYDKGIGQRRLVNYADPLLENGSVQPAGQIRAQPSEFGKTARSPPSNITGYFRPPSVFQNYPPGQTVDPLGHVHQPNVTPSKFGNKNQSPFHDARAASSPRLNRNSLVSGSGRLRPALGSAASPSVFGGTIHNDDSTESFMDQQETSGHMQTQRLSAPFQSRSSDHTISKRSRSPISSFRDVDSDEAHRDAVANARRQIDYADALFDDRNVETSKRMRTPPSEFTSMMKSPSSDISNNTRSSPAGLHSNGAAQNLRSRAEVQKSSASIPTVGNQIQSRIGAARSPPQQQMSHHSDSYSNEHNTPAVSPPKPSIFSANKRTGAPPLDISDDDNIIHRTETEREKQAKANRLARFNVELSRPVENINDFANANKDSADKSIRKIPFEANADTNERNLSDMDSSGLAAIVGLCPAMCPEPERAERERKGDLDRYERLSGDRHQTTELLAVKKYNRTAERDADLIRPLPVLQNTMDYLLSLLDQTYDDSFLGLYNFLWDRMRAIRMDLRMQHFFNREAISMLEQMIRLHIIAMHELCEYNRGEGFSEGFDAHLNIEQMNKTSVELFQMYDDHRRKGLFFPTEKEFRGYYALLKLDKHPGYKVEPAELSLDLAKMSRELRGSTDILFAREVARACRMGNFIAFFRLARKATYLQACLMHAHFAKLRRQALASLHSGLQNSQGIPISEAVEWLAMEDEDIDSLLEYYGFGLRQYEELYLVKEGPFLNSESDFPSGCSQLVHSKKSQRIINDVSSGPVCAPTSQKKVVASYSGWFASSSAKRDLVPPLSAPAISANARRESGLSFTGPVSPTSGRDTTSLYSGPFSPKSGSKQFSLPYSSPISPSKGRKDSVSDLPCAASPRKRQAIFSHTGRVDEQRVASPKAESKTRVDYDFMPEVDDTGLAEFPQGQIDAPWTQPITHHVDSLEETVFVDSGSLDYSDMHREEDELRTDSAGIGDDMDDEGPSDYEVNLTQLVSPTDSHLSDHEDYADHMIGNRTSDELLPMVVSPKKKIPNERLKMMLRKWRQHAAEKRFLREQKNALAIAALSSLSLGPPVHPTAMVPIHAVHKLDIGHAFKERHSRQQISLSRLNVSELAGPILIERNPDARCLCWKLLVLVPPGAMEYQTSNFSSRWLLKKLLGSGNEGGGLLFSSADLSIWTKWISYADTCCLSVVRANDQQVIANDITNSTNCIIFVVSESIPWEIQKARFSSLLASIPDKANLPLLILSGDKYNEGYDYASQHVINRLGLSGLSEGKITSSLVVFLVADNTEGYANGFFDDDKLRQGLKWLVCNSPLQPDITLVKTHELILNYLNPFLESLNNRVTPEVGPEHCVSVFNDAVNQLAEEILTAVSAAPIQWPAPEVDLLERSSSERIFTEMFLPSIGWSLPSRIQPLLATIKSCKLPQFSHDLSWLNQGSYMGRQIQDQKLFLEECLTKYLTQSAKLLNETQAATEVKIMVQKGVGLELRGSYYYLVPRWVTIFRRIFNWRLAKLSTGEFSEAYVLSQHLRQAAAAHSNGGTQQGLTANRSTSDEVLVLEDHSMMPAVSTGLTLDEIIEVSYDLDAAPVPPATPLRGTTPLPSQPTTQVREEPEPIAGELNGMHGVVNEMHTPRRVELRELVPLEKDDDKLSRLLEHCSKLQDRIDETLSIYF